MRQEIRVTMHFKKRAEEKPAFETVRRLVDFFRMRETIVSKSGGYSDFSRVKENYQSDAFFQFYYFQDEIRPGEERPELPSALYALLSRPEKQGGDWVIVYDGTPQLLVNIEEETCKDFFMTLCFVLARDNPLTPFEAVSRQELPDSASALITRAAYDAKTLHFEQVSEAPYFDEDDRSDAKTADFEMEPRLIWYKP